MFWQTFAIWVSRHPLRVLLLWVALFAVAAPLASTAASRFKVTSSADESNESFQVAIKLISEFKQIPQDSLIVVSNSDQASTARPFKDMYQQLIQRLNTISGINSITRYDQPSLLKLNGKIKNKFVTATLVSVPSGETSMISSIRQELQRMNSTTTQWYLTGASAITRDFAESSERDVKNGELTALPLTALILIITFGSLIAAGLPIVVGLFSITTALAALALLANITPISSFAQSVVTLFGLGAGIDYALLIVNRFREELKTGSSVAIATQQTILTAGRAVLLSGLTVAIALGALLIPNYPFTRSLGIAGLLVVSITVLTAITALPALLRMLGENVNFPRRLYRFTRASRQQQFWGKLAETVMQKPLLYGGIVMVFLIVLALPALSLKFGYTGAFGLAPSIESRKGLELIRPLELGGALDAFEIIVDLGQKNAYTAETRAKYRKLDKNLSAQKEVRLVISPFLTSRIPNSGSNTLTQPSLVDLVRLTRQFITDDRRYLRVAVIPKQPLAPAEIDAWIAMLRLETSRAGFTAFQLGGQPVTTSEINRSLLGSMIPAVLAVFVVTFFMMVFAFRSLLIPLKSIFLNTLTIAATFGILTLVFQYGWFAQLIGAPTDVGVIDVTLPLVLFAISFGLSMDYEIFLLARVQEAHNSGLSTNESVKQAVEKTAGVITSAALIMVIVFAAFIPGVVIANKTIGLGLVIAVFLDATVVRLILVPAAMVLAGKWNWWLPTFFEKYLPKIKLEH